MSTTKASAPERELRGRQCTEQEPSDQAETARSHSIVNESGAHVNVSRRSPLLSALALALVVFAVAYLAGHILAAIIGWHWLVYVGVGVGIWFIASALVCAFVAGAAGDD